MTLCTTHAFQNDSVVLAVIICDGSPWGFGCLHNYNDVCFGSATVPGVYGYHWGWGGFACTPCVGRALPNIMKIQPSPSCTVAVVYTDYIKKSSQRREVNDHMIAKTLEWVRILSISEAIFPIRVNFRGYFFMEPPTNCCMHGHQTPPPERGVWQVRLRVLGIHKLGTGYV
jgi:hypothetical protein